MRRFGQLFLVGSLTTLLILPGGAPLVSDSAARLGVAHWLMTGQPPLAGLPSTAPVVLQDRWGNETPWYGLGQSLLMAPVDAAATLAGVDSARGRFTVVEYVLFPAVNGLAVAAAGTLLVALGFGTPAALAGALSLVFCSTLLWHFQNNQENPLQLVLVLIALCASLAWLESGQRRTIVVMGAALGLDLLIRLPNVVDVAAVSALPAVVLWLSQRQLLRRYFSAWGVYAFPGIASGLIADRLYHFARFGEWKSTYMHMSGVIARYVDPTLPADFPFSNPFWLGFLGPLLSPQKAIFIYDPLLVLALICLVRGWRRFDPRVRAIALISVGAVLCYSAGYATFYNWAGEPGWGDRFVANWVWILCLLAIPMSTAVGVAKKWLVPILVVAFSFQAVSIVIPPWVEEIQFNSRHVVVRDRFVVSESNFRGFVLARRFQNLAGGALRKFGAWGLGDTPNGQIGLHPPLIPVVMELRSLPRPLSYLYRIAWISTVLYLVCLIRRMLRRAAVTAEDRRPQFDGDRDSPKPAIQRIRWLPGSHMSLRRGAIRSADPRYEHDLVSLAQKGCGST